MSMYGVVRRLQQRGHELVGRHRLPQDEVAGLELVSRGRARPRAARTRAGRPGSPRSRGAAAIVVAVSPEPIVKLTCSVSVEAGSVSFGAEVLADHVGDERRSRARRGCPTPSRRRRPGRRAGGPSRARRGRSPRGRARTRGTAGCRWCRRPTAPAPAVAVAVAAAVAVAVARTRSRLVLDSRAARRRRTCPYPVGMGLRACRAVLRRSGSSSGGLRVVVRARWARRAPVVFVARSLVPAVPSAAAARASSSSWRMIAAASRSIRAR